MAAPSLPKPPGPEVASPATPPAPVVPTKAGRVVTEFRRALEAITLVLGPGILIDYLLHAVGHAEAAGPAALVVAAACALGLYLSRVRLVWFLSHRRILIPWCLVIVLSIVVAVLLHRPIDHWRQWQRDVNEAVKGCGKDDARCVGRAVASRVPKRPSSQRVSTVSLLSNDLIAGELLLENPMIASELDGKLSVRSEFVGSGLSEPVGSQSYEAARLPEYLVPNWRKEAPRVWTWELPLAPTLDRPLSEVLATEPPMSNGQGAFSLQDIEQKSSVHLQPNDQLPYLVRFTQLLPRKYRGCLGRSAASRVFMTHLGVALKLGLTVEQAARYAGYKLSANSTGGEKMFIWVFEPASDSEAVPATWSNILANLETWLEQPGCTEDP